MEDAQAAGLLDRIRQLEQYAINTEGRFAALAPTKKAPSLRQPDSWDGKGDPQLRYIIPMGNWVAHQDMQDKPSCIPYLLSALPAVLQLRYHKHVQDAHRSNIPLPQNAAQFFALVEEWVPAPNRLRDAREKLQKLRHYKGRIYQYNSLFSEYALEIGTNMTEFDLNWIYLHGLQPDVMREVDMHVILDSTPLSELMTKASNAESRLRDLADMMGPVRSSPFRHPGYGLHGAPHTVPSGNDPMELGMMRRHGRGAGRPIKQPFQGDCYKCGQPGHRQHECHAAGPRKPPHTAHAARGRRR
jgi:hypothetical protein